MVRGAGGKSSHEGFRMSDKEWPSEEIDAPLPIIATPGEGVSTWGIPVLFWNRFGFKQQD